MNTVASAWRIGALGAIVIAGAAGAPAQVVRVDSLTAVANTELARGKPIEACRVYEEALALDENNREALLGRGKALLQLNEYGEAEDCFLNILERDTADVAAQYYAGITFREVGKTKAWLLRNKDWNNARDYFQRVIRRDSAYDDVFYQYARLLAYRGDFPEAIAAGHTQLRVRPDLAAPRIGLFKIYRAFVADDRASAIPWLQREQTPIAECFLAEALRREKHLDEADSVLQRLLTSGALPITQLLHLTLARIDAQRGDLAGAEAHARDAINQIFTQLGADIVFEDVKYLVTDRELALYRSLDSPAKKAGFFRAFWSSRNPAAASRSNIRIGEHYRRLVYAEENFEYTGFRTGFNNPDRYRELTFPASYALNEEFNDEGLIYIRHGQPSSIQRSLRSASDLESWLYDATAGTARRIFHFQKRNASGNNWRLIPYPNDAAQLEALSTWDIRFADLLRNDASIAARTRDEFREESRETVSDGLSSDEHVWPKEVTTFRLSYSVDAFRGSGAKALLDISYAVPLSMLAAGRKTTGDSIPCETGISIRHRSGPIALQKVDTMVVPATLNEKDAFTNLYRYLIPPGTYTIAMHVRSLEGNSFGSWRIDKTIPVPSPELSLSDIQYLIPSAIKSTMDIDGVKVVPSPFSAYRSDHPLYTYLHVYGLVKDADGKTAYTARYYLTPLKSGEKPPVIDPENPDEAAVVVAERSREGSEETAQEFAPLDVSKVRAGRHLLTIAVKDRKRVQTVTAAREVDILKP
ncbi:MAG: GWxTD domain-containing protein [Bacteroidota bacterium]